MRVVTIVKDDGITGIEYGTIEVPEKSTRNYKVKNIVNQYTQNTMRNRMRSIVERQKHK